jgi:hypothetical protein
MGMTLDAATTGLATSLKQQGLGAEARMTTTED